MSSNGKPDPYRAAKPASTGAAPPAAEPAPFQKPPGSLDEAAVRGNNPEPEAEPAPCGTCGGRRQVFDRPRVGPLDTKSACPECRPGGAA